MATIQQSIEINVPLHAVYDQLTQFEDYPQFMEEIEAVQQIDDTHLHWTTSIADRPAGWDAEITRQEPDSCIEWQYSSGPLDSGRIDVQAAGADASKVVFTWQAATDKRAGLPAGRSQEEMTQRLKQDLARLKDFIEARGSEAGAWRSDVQDREIISRDRDAKNRHGKAANQQQSSMPADQTMQSDYSLSKPAGDESADDGRFSIAAEVNLDQQSDQVRRVGKMPKDSGTERSAAPSPADAMSQAMQPDQSDTADGKDAGVLKKSVNRAVPPSE